VGAQAHLGEADQPAVGLGHEHRQRHRASKNAVEDRPNLVAMLRERRKKPESNPERAERLEIGERGLPHPHANGSKNL
jgi:hypothetical protein